MAKKTLSALKEEMIFNTNLYHLVDVMKGIAAAQYHVMERNQSKFPKYEEALGELFQSYDFRRSRHPFLRAQSDRTLMIVVSTDFGFLGGLNMKVMQAAMAHETKNMHYFVIGERGANNLKEYQKEHTAFPGISVDATRFDLVEQVLKKIKEHPSYLNCCDVCFTTPDEIFTLMFFKCSRKSRRK